MHSVTKGLPKKSPRHRDDDTAFKNANKPPKKGKKHSLQNTPPPVAENSCDVAATQGPQKQMDAKNNTIKRPAKTKEPKKKKANKQLRTAHSEISPCWPTRHLPRSPQTPEQQQARRKDPPKKKCYSDLKASNRPQANIK
jgi:hypothetical protein